VTSRTPDEWTAVVRDELVGLVGPTTLVGSVQVDVSGGPDGDRSLHVEFDTGRVTDAGSGPCDAPDTTLSLTHGDARAVLSGELEPSVAFMQGRMKVAGDMGVALDLLALSATEEARRVRSRMADLATG
jgi:putative sterol carrier protein